MRSPALATVAAGLLLMACAPSAAPGATSAPAKTQGPVHLTAAVQSDPAVLSDTIRQLGQGIAGLDQLQFMVNSGTAGVDDQGELHPLMSEAVPSTENGLWVVLPDGRMETTWRIREGAQWHDGQPLTAADLLFTANLGQDKQLAIFGDPVYEQIQNIREIDSRTLTVAWKRPYIKADFLFVTRPNLPVPKHLLERPYLDDKMSIPALPYWHEDFVGTGPFKVRQFVRSSHVSLVANDLYALGRPKVDEIDVRFIPSSTTLEANLLAGAVDLVLGRSLSLEQALVVRDQWQAGHVETGDFSQVMVLYTQFINPSPAIIGDVQFRRALLHAIDRQQLADSLQAGLAPIAHSFLNPGEPDYRAVQDATVRYEYDPRLAAEMLGNLGYLRAADGAWKEPAGQPLSLEIRTTQGDDLQEKLMFAAADQWQRLGIRTDSILVSPQQA
ncbi:MAG TPA: ABC transporter substrate-binding protein, partial [Chloroflexota bacterium]